MKNETLVVHPPEVELAPDNRPLVAPIEDEAEVAIVKRPGSSRPRQVAARPELSEVILPVGYEAQGGEDYDPRTLASFRGAIEEASVEIVVRRPSKRAASSLPDQSRDGARTSVENKVGAGKP